MIVRQRVKRPLFTLSSDHSEKSGDHISFSGNLVYDDQHEVVRQGRYRYIRTPADEAEALYELEADPQERLNLAPQIHDLVSKMRALLTAHRSQQQELNALGYTR